MKAAPVLDTGLSAASHAHPLHVRPSLRAVEEQRVRALIARQNIAVHLQSLPCERASTVIDVLTPKIRRSPFKEIVNPNHLDLTECWKGLSHPQAMELKMWYGFFHKCLRDEVRTSLREDLVQSLLRSEEVVDEVYLVPRILECLRSESHRVIETSFVSLIDSMMSMFHDQFPAGAVSVAPNRSHFSSGLSRFLHSFLRVQDCFWDSPSGPCLVVNFDFQYVECLLTATGNVTWQVPEVRFFDLPNKLSMGEEYRITPFIPDAVFNPVRSWGTNYYVDQVAYALPQSSLSFAWNPMKQCFKAVVPNYADGKSHTIETVLKATVITPFPDDIIFERQSRWSIKLNITPAEGNCEPSIASTNGYAKRADGYHRVCDSIEEAIRDAMSTDLWESKHNAVLRNISENEPDPPFPQKRKVSRPEVAYTALDCKRRRRDSVNEAKNGLLTAIYVGGEMTWATLLEQLCQREAEYTRTDDGRSNAGQLSTDHYQESPPHSWCSQPKQHDSGILLLDTPLVDSESSAPNSAVHRGHDALQQHQILRNYQEFAERKSLKDAGLISPVSDGECKAFESIFLEDGEVWSPVTDGSGVEFDTDMGQI